MRWKIFCSCLVVLLLLPGCGGGGGGGAPSPGDNIPPSPPYNIYGVVRDARGRALSEVDIVAYYKDDPQKTILDAAKTDSQGKYSLWVPWSSSDRIYVITASKTGYDPASQEIRLSSPELPQELNFTLQPADKR